MQPTRSTLLKQHGQNTWRLLAAFDRVLGGHREDAKKIARSRSECGGVGGNWSRAGRAGVGWSTDSVRKVGVGHSHDGGWRGGKAATADKHAAAVQSCQSMPNVHSTCFSGVGTRTPQHLLSAAPRVHYE